MTLELWLALAFFLGGVALTVWACLTGDRPDYWLTTQKLPTSHVFLPTAPTYFTSELNRPEATDGLFDVDSRSLAAVFGQRTHELIRQRADVDEIFRTARLAARHAFITAPELRTALASEPIPVRVVGPRRNSHLHSVQRIH